jgi:ApaG protein
MGTDAATRGGCRGSETLTHGVRVTVVPAYEARQETPHGDRYVFSYRIRVSNESGRRVQLLRRRWLIIDGDGDRHVVEGDGVVGEQPVIEAGSSYEYSSWCPLETSWGTMEGSFEMHAEPGETVSVAVGRFFLVSEPAEQADELS